MLAIVAFALAALAGDPAFDEGVRLYKSFEYEQAIFRFEELALRPALSTSDKAEAFLWLGLSYAGTGDFDAARRALTDAVHADPGLALPPNTSPRVVTLWNEVKTAAATKTTNPTTNPTNPTTTEPTTTEPTTTDPTTAGPPVGAIALTAGGLLALGVGTAFAAFALGDYGEATAPGAFQDEAAAARDAMSLELIGAGLLVPVGVALVGVGGFLLVNDDEAAAATVP